MLLILDVKDVAGGLGLQAGVLEFQPGTLSRQTTQGDAAQPDFLAAGLRQPKPIRRTVQWSAGLDMSIGPKLDRHARVQGETVKKPPIAKSPSARATRVPLP